MLTRVVCWLNIHTQHYLRYLHYATETYFWPSSQQNGCKDKGSRHVQKFKCGTFIIKKLRQKSKSQEC